MQLSMRGRRQQTAMVSCISTGEAIVEKIKDLILEHFPSRERLTYDNFICDEIVEYYYRDEERISTIFEYISRPWEDIPWDLIDRISFDGDSQCQGHLVIEFLNEKSFIHVFPSLLNEVAGEGSGNDTLISDHIIYRHLDLRGVFDDWKLEFYFSLSDEVVKLINLILRTNGSPWALDAIDVYWHVSEEK